MKEKKDADTKSGSYDASNETLKMSTSGASILILVQLFTKLFTFGLNQVLIRFISPTIIGTAAYFEFVSSSILFICREGERLAIQRISDANRSNKKTDNGEFREGTLAGNVQSIINFGFIPIFLGIPLLALFMGGSASYKQTIGEEKTLPLYRECLFIICVSVLIELAAEPLYAKNQLELNMKRRSKIESIAVFGKCIVTSMMVIKSQSISESYAVDSAGVAILAFAVGQLTYSSLIAFSYFYNFQKSPPVDSKAVNKYQLCEISGNKKSYYFNPQVVSFWKTFALQMIFKHFLTEGDKLVMNYFFRVEEQGTYSVIGNYCSLLARILFQPIEESIRLTLTKALASNTVGGRKDLSSSMSYLYLFYLNLSILIVLAGYTNVNFLIKILLSSRLSAWENSALFQVFPSYVLYIPFLAFNGISEAFFDCIATERQIKKFSWFMTYVSGIFFIVSWFFIRVLNLGLHGLILTNILNMAVRIAYCTSVIATYYHAHGMAFSLASCIKRSKTALGLGIVSMVLQRVLLQKAFSETFTDFFKSAVVCAICLAGLLYSERSLLYKIVRK